MNSAALLMLLTAWSTSQPLPCPKVTHDGIRIDGFFQDWEGLVGAQGQWGPDLPWELRAARDDQSLFLIFGAQDNAFVPSPPGANAARLTEGQPVAGDGLRMVFGRLADAPRPPVTLLVLPGDLEERPPTAALLIPEGRRTRITPVKIDGATRPGGGWILELALPLAALPWANTEEHGLRLELKLQDQDAPGKSVAAGEPSPVMLSLVFPETEQNQRLLLQRLNLPPGAQPDLAARCNVGGDERSERLQLFGGRLTLLGEGLGEGAYYLYELPFGDRLRPVSLECRELTGDRLDEIVLRFRVSETRGPERHEQEFFQLFQYADNTVLQVFAAEVIHEGPQGQRVENRVTFLPPDRQGRPGLRIEQGSAANLDVHSYRDVDAGFDNEYEEILLPWSSRQQATYRYQNGRFLRVP